MHTLMSMNTARDLRLWFFMDELGALHRLPALEQGLQTARNFGGAIVTGIHTFAKLKEVYGEDIAKTLASLSRTKLILACGDKGTAEWCSDAIGHQEVVEIDEGYSYGHDNARDAVTSNSKTTIKALVLADQLTNLESLSGYIKFADGFPAAEIKLEPQDRVTVADGFEPRDDNPGMDRAMLPPKPDDRPDGDDKRAAVEDGGTGIEPKSGEEQLAFDEQSEAHAVGKAGTQGNKVEHETDLLSAVFDARDHARVDNKQPEQKGSDASFRAHKNPTTRRQKYENSPERSGSPNDGNGQDQKAAGQKPGAPQKPLTPQKPPSVEDDRDPMKEQREGAIGSREIDDLGDMDI